MSRRPGGAMGVSMEQPAHSAAKQPKLITQPLMAGPGAVVQTQQQPQQAPTVFARLGPDFFSQSCVDLACNLLGKVLTRRLPDGKLLKGIIVETESYLGGEDRCSHSYKNKRTKRNAPMFMAPGTTYVYHIYGKYYCFNISSGGTGAAVLIRAVQPIAGLEFMQEMRQAALKQAPGKRRRKFKAHELCDGPSKMCRAFALTKDECNAVDLSVSDMIWVEPGYVVPRERIVACKRIGVDYYGEEWASKPLRFYAFDSQCVSVRDKPAEALLATTAE